MEELDESCLACEAIAYLSAHGVLDPREKIIRGVTRGELRASGYFTHRVDGNVASEWSRLLDQIPIQFWQARDEIVGRFLEPEMKDEDDWTDDWPNSFFSNEATAVDKYGHFTRFYQSASQVRFKYRDLERLASPPVEGDERQQLNGEGNKPNLGGKPASKHGDVLGAATLRLAALSGAELGRYTTDSLARELANEYARLGEAAPSERNCQRYAAGILRVLRARET